MVLTGHVTGRLATISSQADLWRRRAALVTEQDLSAIEVKQRAHRKLVAECVTVFQEIQREAVRLERALKWSPK